MEDPRHSKRNRAREELDQIRYRLDSCPSPRRDVRSLSDILPDVISGLERPENEDVLVLRKAWPKLCGEQIAKHSEPRFMKDHCLFVYVDHPGWLPELERIKRLLLQKLQAKYGMLKIRSLCLQLTNR